MEAVGVILIIGLVLSVWIATKIGVDHSREVCEEANLKGSLGERIRRAKEEWEAMSVEEKRRVSCESDDSFWEDDEDDYVVDPAYACLSCNISYTGD